MLLQRTEHLVKGVICGNVLTTTESYLRLKFKKKQVSGVAILTVKIFLMGNE